MKEVLYEVRCLKSNEDMILALAGQFKQLSHELCIMLSVLYYDICLKQRTTIFFQALFPKLFHLPFVVRHEWKHTSFCRNQCKKERWF